MRPLDVASAWSLLAPDAAARADVARWSHQARTFFDADVALVDPPPPDAASGLGPLALPDAAELAVAVIALRPAPSPPTRVRVITVPRASAPDVVAAMEAGVRAIGGAGFDALLARAARVWQVAVDVPGGGDPRAPLVFTAVLASTLLAPIVPPGGGTTFGVRGARERLAALKWGR